MTGNGIWQRRVRIYACIAILFLALMPAAGADVALKTPTTEEYCAMNLFLSNFTELGLRAISDSSSDKDLVDFAHDHMWFNSYERFEYGDYFNGNNCRIADTKIQSTIDAYFYDPRDVDLSQTRFDYRDGYYYHQETGGWTAEGFAVATSVCSVGDDVWFISFLEFGAGDAWDNDDTRLTLDEAVAKFGHPCGYGSALVHAADLADRSTYKMISYSQV